MPLLNKREVLTMLTAPVIARFSLPSHVVDACNAVGMTDADVWCDVCQVARIVPATQLAPAAALLEKCLDGADDDTEDAWRDYVDCLTAYVATDRVILRPLAYLDGAERDATEITDVVGGDLRPVWETPAWCEGVDTIGRASDTGNHGAAAMALPCVFYADAVRVMAKYGDDVVQYLDDGGVDALTLSPARQNWHGFASHVLTIAVELWCGQFDDLDTADLYVVESKVKP